MHAQAASAACAVCLECRLMDAECAWVVFGKLLICSCPQPACLPADLHALLMLRPAAHTPGAADIVGERHSDVAWFRHVRVVAARQVFKHIGPSGDTGEGTGPFELTYAPTLEVAHANWLLQGPVWLPSRAARAAGARLRQARERQSAASLAQDAQQAQQAEQAVQEAAAVLQQLWRAARHDDGSNPVLPTARGPQPAWDDAACAAAAAAEDAQQQRRWQEYSGWVSIYSELQAAASSGKPVFAAMQAACASERVRSVLKRAAQLTADKRLKPAERERAMALYGDLDGDGDGDDDGELLGVQRWSAVEG